VKQPYSKANLSRTRKKSNSSDAKTVLSVFYLSFLYLKLDFKYSSFKFSDLVSVEPKINLQLTGKISLKLDSNLSLLLEYGQKSQSEHYLIHIHRMALEKYIKQEITLT